MTGLTIVLEIEVDRGSLARCIRDAVINGALCHDLRIVPRNCSTANARVDSDYYSMSTSISAER